MRAIFAVVVLALSGCSALDGYMNKTVTDPVTGRSVVTRYSPYYEFEQRSDDRAVLARMVITLGDERVPEGHVFDGPFADDLSESRRNGIVPRVWELYLINTSKTAITVTPRSVMGSPSTGGPLQIQPRQREVTSPIVGLHSNYGVEAPVSFEYEYAGTLYTVEGVAKRMTVEQVKEKYGGR